MRCFVGIIIVVTCVIISVAFALVIIRGIVTIYDVVVGYAVVMGSVAVVLLLLSTQLISLVLLWSVWMLSYVTAA